MIRTLFLMALMCALGLVAPARPAGAGDVRDDVKKEVNRKLVGTWKVVSAERDGKELDASIRATRWVVTGTTFTARLPREGKGKFGYQLGEVDRRGTIDIEVLESEWADLGPRKRVYRGIYSLDQETLKVCYGPPYGTEKQRPATFTTKAGSGDTLFVLARESENKKDR
jgi:uncharacterized protein (TIGR03067 family)